MKILDVSAIPWKQAARLLIGPPGLIKLEKVADLEACVGLAMHDGNGQDIPDYLQIEVEGFDLVSWTEVRRLAALLPLREDAPRGAAVDEPLSS